MNLIFRTLGTFFLIAVGVSVQAKVQLNGLAEHSELGNKQFVAAVYAETLTTDARALLMADEDKAMELRMLDERVYPRRFQRMWIEGMAINAGDRELEKYAEMMAQFGNMLTMKLRAGDVLRIERHTGSHVVVTLNGLELGTLTDPRFFDLLLRTWLGPVPLSTDFKEALLAGGEVDTRMREAYLQIMPTPERIAALGEMIGGEAASSPNSDEKPLPEVASIVAPTPVLPLPPAPALTRVEPSASEAQAQAKPTPEREPSVVQKADPAPREDENSAVAINASSLLSEQRYISLLTRRTGSFVEYPRSALKRNQEGTVRLIVTVARSGEVIEVGVLEKSRYDSLNQAAREAVEKASPYPPIPEDLSLEEYRFTVPVAFRIRG